LKTPASLREAGYTHFISPGGLKTHGQATLPPKRPSPQYRVAFVLSGDWR
jgi:hypothetical protein